MRAWSSLRKHREPTLQAVARGCRRLHDVPFEQAQRPEIGLLEQCHEAIERPPIQTRRFGDKSITNGPTAGPTFENPRSENQNKDQPEAQVIERRRRLADARKQWADALLLKNCADQPALRFTWRVRLLSKMGRTASASWKLSCVRPR
jgi:hypothetical protein